MKNRLLSVVQAARRRKKKIFCAFLTLGYPSIQATEQLIEGFSRRGVDIIELGFPFSDPLADGPTIQFSSEQALKRRVKIEDAFRLVEKLRRRGIETPILFFSYLNPIFHYGEGRFPEKLRRAGFDGLIVPDCPPEEDPLLWKNCARAGIASVFLAAPTTRPERARKIYASSRGFLYYVSVRGVTGGRRSLPGDLKSNLRKLLKKKGKAVLVGFGVSTPEQVRKISRLGDGVIVGSALIDRIRRSGGRLGPVFKFVESLTRPLQK